jgi:Gram-negative bacterial TonB protein C-terminal
VAFEARVTSEGAVEGVEVLTSPRPGLGFEAAVQGAVAKWRFDPARVDGQPIASIYKGTITYSLDLPYDRARLYALPSRQVWEHLLTLLKELGLQTDDVDRDAQVVITKWQDVDRSTVDGLPDVNLPFPYAARRFQLHIFVSPYAEPARVLSAPSSSPITSAPILIGPKRLSGNTAAGTTTCASSSRGSSTSCPTMSAWRGSPFRGTSRSVRCSRAPCSSLVPTHNALSDSPSERRLCSANTTSLGRFVDRQVCVGHIR